jgi:uncharacterized paraquat-inducible protein A
MQRLDNVADKYDNTKLKALLSLSSFVCIGIVIYQGIVFGLSTIFASIGILFYTIIMLIHMYALKDEQRHKIFQWQHSQILIYVFFGLWALADIYLVYQTIQSLINGLNLFTVILPVGGFTFFQLVSTFAGFFLFQRNRLEAEGLPQGGSGPLLQ